MDIQALLNKMTLKEIAGYSAPMSGKDSTCAPFAAFTLK